jgi:hypothetical protein
MQYELKLTTDEIKDLIVRQLQKSGKLPNNDEYSIDDVDLYESEDEEVVAVVVMKDNDLIEIMADETEAEAEHERRSLR